VRDRTDHHGAATARQGREHGAAFGSGASGSLFGASGSARTSCSAIDGEGIGDRCFFIGHPRPATPGLSRPHRGERSGGGVMSTMPRLRAGARRARVPGPAKASDVPAPAVLNRLNAGGSKPADTEVGSARRAGKAASRTGK